MLWVAFCSFAPMRKLLYAVIVLLAVAMLLVALRVPLLRGLSAFLIETEPPRKSDVIFVLSGNAYDRGVQAARLYKSGFAPVVICTGGNFDGNMLALGKEFFEADLTRAALLTNGVDSGVVGTLPQGTSTKEEADSIELYCKTKKIESCIVVTSMFHTRRVRWMLEKRLEDQGIATHVVGAKSRFYEPDQWWKSEVGVIDLNNEYVKLLYYAIKY